MKEYPPLVLTPEQYERDVKKGLDALGSSLHGYQSQHREIIPGLDGEYEIDISVRFTELQVDFLVLVECKYYRRPVEREKVQALLSKIQATGAHKGIMFSTSGFQTGAREFAAAHGIGLVQFVDGRSAVIQKAAIPPDLPPLPPIGWLMSGNSMSLVAPDHPNALRKFLSGS